MRPLTLLSITTMLAGSVIACGGDKSAATVTADGSTTVVTSNDGGASHLCPAQDAGAPDPDAASDDFGPNATEATMTSPLARLDFYEITAPSFLKEASVYVRPTQASTRLTIAVHEASARNQPFHKLAEVQVDAPTCAGWVSTGPLDIPLVVGRFYTVGFDPNQDVAVFMITETGSIPIDGEFVRLIGSKTTTSVSVDDVGWDKLTDGSYYRQRLVTAPRTGDADAAAPAIDAPTASHG